MHKKLTKFLESDKRPEGTMSLPEVYGFLFSVCSAPEPVTKAEWLEVIYNGKPANYKSDEKRAKIEASLDEVYAEVEALTLSDDGPRLPEFIEILEPALENVGDGAPLAFWSDGFFDGMDWLENVWRANLDEDGEKIWQEAVKVLVHFSHREAAQALCKGSGEAWVSDEHLTQRRLDGFAEAMATYVRMGRALAQSPSGVQPLVREVKLGRNDPCLCGSGQKYKKCCLNA